MDNFVFLKIQINEEDAGVVIIELFNDIAPKACENFRKLCTGEKGRSNKGTRLHYKNTVFHKAISQCMIQGGDIVKFNGTGGESIYGKDFEDESFEIKHTEGGLVGLANSGSHSNHSQFYITVDSCPQLDNAHVIFGKVRRGLGVVLEAYTGILSSTDRKPCCKIADCGVVKSDVPWSVFDDDGTSDKYPAFPDDWNLADVNDEINYESVITNIKDVGNQCFRDKEYARADHKYKKALRYLDWFKATRRPDNCIKLLQMKKSALLNLAAVRLQRNRPLDAVDFCTQVLDVDRKSGKAFYRRGQGYFKLNEFNKSMDDFKLAKELIPNNQNIYREYQRAKKHRQVYLNMEREMCSKMFQ